MPAILLDARIRRSLLVLAVALGAATVAVVPPARGGTAELVVHFITADGNIECEMVDPNTTLGNVTCVMHSKGYTTRGDLDNHGLVGSSRVDLQACKLEYSIVSPK